ncbi:MAG: dihydroneopterin aldolase [Kiritimatiellia bacterium]|jgi:dihydroneopterin aldolase
MDKFHHTIFLRNLEIDVLIGVLPEERTGLQRLVLNVEAVCEVPLAGVVADDIRGVVDYRQIRQAAVDAAAGTAFQLVETLASRIAKAILAVPGVLKVAVTLDKPGALEGCESVAVRCLAAKDQ